MDIASILSPECVLFKNQCNSKKRILETIASHLCDENPVLDPGHVFSALIARERLGSTGIGHGIAIPHCRIKGCSKIIGVLVTLDNGIDFDAIDNEPVDIIFVLVVPEDENQDHLQTLAALAERFSDKERLNKIRQASSSQELYQTITE
ncbi:MAG: PTS IIA-like nitrogen regulatory protein PtsN [Cellvibrionaceae bacterium]